MIAAGWQIREARRLVGLSQHDLAMASGVMFDLVTRVELMDRFQVPGEPHVAAMQSALEAVGVEFIPQIDARVGVRLRVSSKTTEEDS